MHCPPASALPGQWPWSCWPRRRSGRRRPEPQDAGAQATEQQVVAPVDPIIAEVRRRLAEPARRDVHRGDRAALTAFYAARTGEPLWVTSSGLNMRAQDAIAEIRKAEDWGLSLAAFELPRPVAADASPAALADAEITGRPRRPGIRAPCPRRTPRPVLAERQLRCEAARPRSQAGAGGRVHHRHGRLVSGRPASQARAVPEAARGARQNSRRRQQARAGCGDAGEAAGQRTGPQARHDACRRRPAAAAAQGAGRSRPRDLLRPGAEGGCGRLPAREQDGPRRGDRQPHALRAERQRAAQAGAGGFGDAAPDRQHGALALAARGTRRLPRVGQHP